MGEFNNNREKELNF
jgi:hypothetical protein